MPNPLVSICMPAFNAGNYINDAVRSILNQSYINWELIIVDDGSTDNTLAELKKIKDERIIVVTQQNKGQCSAANKAYSLSTGTMVKFMDADDLISENYILDQVKCLDNELNAIALAVWGRFYDNDLRTFKLNEVPIEQDCNPIDWLVIQMQNKQPMMQCALWLIPRTIIELSGLWDERLSLINDFEFFIRVLLCAEKIKITPDAILYYRSGLTSLSKLRSRKGAESAYSSINWGTNYMLQHENSDRVQLAAANCFQNFVYDFYPDQDDLTYKAEQKIKNLGGSNIPFPAGGYTKICQYIIGWKLTKKLKRHLIFN